MTKRDGDDAPRPATVGELRGIINPVHPRGVCPSCDLLHDANERIAARRRIKKEGEPLS